MSNWTPVSEGKLRMRSRLVREHRWLSLGHAKLTAHKAIGYIIQERDLSLVYG